VAAHLVAYRVVLSATELVISTAYSYFLVFTYTPQFGQIIEEMRLNFHLYLRPVLRHVFVCIYFVSIDHNYMI
jgi:nicotinamide riboside kinase